ncbi:amidohydrolase, partial [Salmonella enterica]|nr:amidohydrolase [Salmonella enterica]
MLMISLVPPLLSRTALLFLLMATGAATAARPAADIILHNGNIITLNNAQPQASAL